MDNLIVFGDAHRTGTGAVDDHCGASELSAYGFLEECRAAKAAPLLR